MRRAAALLALFLLAIAAATGSAQRNPQQSPLVFRSSVAVVLVDVSVLDEHRRPVLGLKTSDFTVFEDRTPQRIVSFDERNAPEWNDAAPEWARAVVPDVKVNNTEDGRLLVLVLDDPYTHIYGVTPPGQKVIGADPRAAVKAAARALVNRLGPADLALVMFTFKQAGQLFTGDRAHLLAAIDEFEPRCNPIFGVSKDVQLLRDSNLEQAARGLAGVAQRRKALVLISTQVRMPHEALEWAQQGNVTIYGINPMMLTGLDAALSRAAGQGGEAAPEPDSLEPLSRAVGALWKPIPPVSPLPAMPVDMRDAGGPQGPRQAGSPVLPMSESPDADAFQRSRQADFEGLNRMIRSSPDVTETGGFLINNTRDMAAGLTQIMRESGSYYLLGYSSSNKAADGRLRSLEVRVNRPGVTVSARRGYYGERPPAPGKPPSPSPARGSGAPASAASTTPSPLVTALKGLLPTKDIPMRVTVAPFAIPGKKEVAIAVVLGLRQSMPVGATGPVADTVDFMTAAYSPDGAPRGKPQHTVASLKLLPGPDATMKYEILSRIDLPPGRYHVRFSVHSKALDKAGSIYDDIDVPDFSKAPLSLSGVVVSATPPLTSGPKGLLAALLPVTPTTQREFMGHAATAFMRVYEGGKAPIAPVTVATRVLNERDATVFSTTDVVAVDRFTNDRAADYRWELPITRLTPGRYDVVFEARLEKGASARRDVQVVVR